MSNEIRLDAFPPPEMAERAENVGVKKANLDFWGMFALAVLAGAFIGLGAEFCTLVITDSGLGFGLNKLLGGFVFSLGLILVVVAGAELFTGNNLIIMAWVGGKLTLGRLMRNWVIVYLGNLVGSLATAMLMYFTRQWAFANYHVGATALNIANGKVNLSFTEGLARGILCNALVCLAVWLCLSGRSVTDKILAILFPITAFVASGFEHRSCQHVLHPYGTPVEGGAAGGGSGRQGGQRPDQPQFAGFHWEPHLRDHRQHLRRRVHGGCDLLVHLPASPGGGGALWGQTGA